MQACTRCGTKGDKLIISKDGLCTECELAAYSQINLNIKDIMNTQESTPKDIIKDGILMLIPVIIIVILIFSFF